MIDLEIDKLCEFTYVMKDNSYSVCYNPNGENWIVVNYRELPKPRPAETVEDMAALFNAPKHEPMTIAAGGTLEECFDWIRNAIQS